MKLSGYCIALMLLFTGCSDEEGIHVLNGDIKLKSQAEVDAFVKQIRVFKYVEISGDLIIGNDETLGIFSDIKDISGLSDIISVNGQLMFMQNSELVKVSMSNLQRVGNLNFNRNNRLEKIEFNNLKIVDEQFTIYHNSALKNIDGFQNLESIGSFLNIDFNQSLESIVAFTNIKTLYNLSITSNSSLIDISGFSTVEDIEANLIMFSNDDLVSISDFEQLSHIGGNLELSWPHFGNDKVTEVKFSNLSVVEGDLNVVANPDVLEVLLPSLDSVKGSIGIGAFNHINNCQYLTNLKYAGSIRITGEKVQSIDELVELEEVKDHFIIEQTGLTDFNLPNLKTVKGYVSIDHNQHLSSIEGIANVRGLQFINIESNPLIHEYCALEDLFTSIVVSRPDVHTNFLIGISDNGSNSNYESIVLTCE